MIKLVAFIPFAGIGVRIAFYILGLMLCALINGYTIGFVNRFLEKNFTFKDALPLRNKIEEK